MDDKTTQELNALEQAILNDPVNYLNTEHEPRTWNLSTTDLARSVSITPESILSTSRERFGPEKESIAETALKELWRGFKGTAQTIADGTTEDYARTVLYRSPNIRKEDADRIMDDIINSGYIAREAESVRRAESIHDPFTAGISNGIGSMIYLALVGATTRSPLAVGAIAGTSEAYSAREEMVDSYVREQGSAKDVSKKLGEFNGKAIAYGAFAGAVEMSIGVERLAAGAVRRYTKLDALSRLARQQGKYGKSAAIKAAKELGTTGAEEAGEEFLQSIGQDISTQGFTEAFTDENFKKALTQAMYGGIIGGPSGAAFYYVGRKMTIDKVNEWNKENNIGLTEQQVVNVADEIIDNGTHQMADEIATRAELQLHYGQAFETVKQKIKDVITGTGTIPWTDETKTIDEYADTVAKTITLPMILQANKAKLPLSEFLDVVKMHVVQGVNGPTPILQLEPIEDIDQLKAMLAEQDAIIKEQTDAAKLGVAKEGAKEAAQRRKAILKYRIREMEAEQNIQKAKTTRRREKADYITAKDLQPEQTATIDTAQTAEVGQDFVLIAGKRIPVEYQVVDLSEIQPSHIDGEVNPNYTNKELQNRASRGTTQDVADLREKAQNITPERLMRAVTSAEGAPLVNAQGEVIAGNGRAEIVRYAYENPETAQKYRTALEQAGFSTEGIERPILVRRNTSMTPEEQIAAADISNISETSAFDEASQARRDSKYLAGSTTPLEFAGKIPMSERRGMMQNNGKWNIRRVNDRYEAALLSWLCGNDTQLFEALVLDGKLTHKVLDVLTANGNLIYETATKYPDTQLREDLYHALVKMQVANKNNFLEITQQIEIDGRDVMAENVFVWAWIYTDATTNRQMLRNYATKLSENHEQVANGQDMFGEQVAPLSNKDAMLQALKTTDEERAQAAAQQGNQYEPLFSAETGEIKNAELAAAIASYQNQFAIPTNTEGGIYNKIAYTSGATYFERPSTKFVLQGGEGQIVHGWGVYSMEDQKLNKQRYRDVFAGKPVYIINEATQEAVPLSGLGMFAQNVSDRAKRIIDENYGTNAIDEVVATNPKTYGGFIGLTALISYMPATYMTDFMDSIAKGKTTFDNIDQDPDYGYIKDRAKNGVKITKILKSIIESAHKKYNSATLKKIFPDADTRTWAAISEAVRNLTKAQKEAMLVYIDETWEMPTKDADIFIQTIQHPERLKRTRGQQLAIEVPNADEVLNEDMVLADQASAPKIRAILEDFLPGGLLFDFVEKADENDFDIFREIHNIKAKDLHEFSENAFEEAQETMFTDNPKMPESGKLLIDYLMNNMKGDDFYVALMETIPETYIELKSGEAIGEEKDYESIPEQRKTVMGVEDTPPELARDASLFLNDQGIKGIQYRGGTDRTGYVTFSDDAIKVLKRLDDKLPIYYKRAGMQSIGVYDAELQTIVLGKAWDEVTLVHEFHHRYLQKIWDIYQQAQAGTKTVTPEWLEDTRKLFEMLEINPNQDELTTVQQEKFAYMVEAYITGLGVENQDNLAFQGFLHWVPEKYTSIMSIGYLDENGIKQNPYLDEESIAFFNRWFASPFVPSLPSSPDAQRMVNPTNEDGEPIPSNQKVMNNREKEWGQDSEEQNKADAQLWRAIGENNPSTIRAQMDGEKEIMKAEADNNPDDRILPEKPKLRDKWFHARQPDARETAAEAARAYVNNNPDHARELAFADPETMTEYDAPVDQGMLIRAVMETVQKGSDEWYILDNNLAMVKSMSGSTLALSGDMSHQAYLDAKREVEEARELKAAVNYAGTNRGAMEKWQSDINRFIAARVGSIIATTPNSKEREVAIKAFLEEAKTKFSGNTTNAILNKYDFTGYTTKDTGAFIKWAEKQIKEAAHAKIDTKEQAELMKASIAAQVALKGINSTEQKDGNFVRAVQSAKDIRHWQFVKDKMKKAYIGRWGKFGIWVDNVLGGYMPSAMLMSLNTLFFANVPSTALNTTIVQQAVKLIGENNVDEKIQKDEIKRIRQVFNGSGMNLAQMEKPTSPSLMHGEKYTNQEQAHWYNFTFNILGREDNWFRIPTFVDALARIATKNANGNKAKANQLFRMYSELGNKDEDAQMARKEALAVANMAVFTQDGIMASALNHIRSQINTATRRLAGLEPGGFGLGNLLAPFLKTGANVVEMGLTSTIAPIRTIGYGLKKLQGKQIPDVDKIALATDWTYFALTAVAVALMAAISGDDDDWYEKPYQTGKRYDPDKPYDSIRFGNYWVKLDIFGPWEIPLRTAAILVQDWEKKKLAAIGEGMYEALSETPLVNQFVDNQMDYMQRNPEKYWPSFAYNQVNKLVPAQIKTATRGISRATGAELDVSALGKTVERKFHRNYGLDGAQLTTNDLLNMLTNRLKYNPQ